MEKKCCECGIKLADSEIKEVASVVGYFCSSCADKAARLAQSENEKWWKVSTKEY